MLLRGLTWLVLLQLLGSALNALLLPALPGPIIGMLLLFALLLLRGEVGEPLNQAASGLLLYLPLLLVPAAAGIVDSGSVLLGNLLAISAALVISLLITVPFCGWLMQRLTRRLEQREDAR